MIVPCNALACVRVNQVYFTVATLGSLSLVAYASLHCERGTAFSTAILTSTRLVPFVDQPATRLLLVC